MFKTIFALTLLVAPLASQAQDAHFLRKHSGTSSCSARAIDRYYCPWFSDQFRGPYFDNGCSVRCPAGQKAVCHEATCDDNQSGEPIDSSCTCR